jgi:hypothetical protein
MEFVKRQIRSSKVGLTEAEARKSLIKEANFPEGYEISNLRKEGGRWIASVFIPKTSAPPFPPDNDNEENDELPEPKIEDKEEGGPPSDEGGDDSGPPKEKSDHKPEDKSEKGELGEVLDLLHMLLDAIAGPTPPMGPGAGGPPLPGGPPGPPPGPPGGGGPGGPPGGPKVQEVIHRRGLKPGESPPGSTPVGSPSFSSVIPLSEFNTLAPETNGRDENGKPITLAQAKKDLERQFTPYGFKVAQIKRHEDKIAALLTRR